MINLTFPVKSLLQAANPHKNRAILTNPSTVPEYQWVYYVDVLSNPLNERCLRRASPTLPQPKQLLTLEVVLAISLLKP